MWRARDRLPLDKKAGFIQVPGKPCDREQGGVEPSRGWSRPDFSKTGPLDGIALTPEHRLGPLRLPPSNRSSWSMRPGHFRKKLAGLVCSSTHFGPKSAAKPVVSRGSGAKFAR